MANNKKKIEYKGIVYRGEKKNGSVIVRVKSTAEGQTLVAGVLNIATKTWQNDNGRVVVPDFVRRKFEQAFA